MPLFVKPRLFGEKGQMAVNINSSSKGSVGGAAQGCGSLASVSDNDFIIGIRGLS